MKITLGPSEDQTLSNADCQYPTVTIDHPSDDLDIEEVVEYLIKPALLAFSFGSSVVDRVTVEELVDEESE